MRPLAVAAVFVSGACAVVIGRMLAPAAAPLADIAPVPASAATNPPSAVAALRPGEPVPDAVLLDQDGRTFRLSDLRGRPVVLSFIYTHCNMPSMCPLASAKLVEACRLARTRGCMDVQFVLASFDSERDRPDRLREFAARFGERPAGFTLAVGEPDAVGPLAAALNTYYRRTAGAVFEHNIVVSVIDRDGNLRDDFFSTGWKVEDLVDAIAKVSP